MTPRLGLAALAAAGLLAAAAGVCRAAEHAVGLEAQGADLQAILQSPPGLDLRDELGRPISRRLIERQLKAAQAAAAADEAFASRLPKARAMARVLELWEGIASALRAPRPWLPWREMWALPGSKTACKAAAPRCSPLPAAVIAAGFLRRCSLFLPRASAGAPLVLRC